MIWFNLGPAEPRYAQICSAFTNSADPDHLTAEEANSSESALFAIHYANLY